jgi:predicted nucleotidyltransferase
MLVEFAPGEKSFDHFMFMALAHTLEDRLGRSVDLYTTDSASAYMDRHPDEVGAVAI